MQNALNFPAAILQPPYFDANADAAHNYGSMGAIIGHEISHSFDDQGSQFDAEGRLANWWTKEDFDHFKAAGEALAAQFDAYRPFPDLAVNGHQTLSENIADVAGLLAAYDAYRLSLRRKAGRRERRLHAAISGSSSASGRAGDPRYAMRNCAERSPPTAMLPNSTAPMTVRNLDAWYDAFSVHPPQKLYLAPPDRVHVW